MFTIQTIDVFYGKIFVRNDSIFLQNTKID